MSSRLRHDHEQPAPNQDLVPITQRGIKMENATATPTVPGTPHAGGFYAGRINVDGAIYALFVAPKATGGKKSKWNTAKKAVAGAQSYFDGLANTNAMAEAGSKLAKWALGLTIAGH